MRERAHGVEDVNGVAGTVKYRGVGLFVSGVGVAERDNHAACVGAFDEIEGARDFGSQGEDFDKAGGGFEITIEESGGGLGDSSGGMNAAAGEADKRAFQMD